MEQRRDTKRIGDFAELAVMTALVEAGYRINIPFGENHAQAGSFRRKLGLAVQRAPHVLQQMKFFVGSDVGMIGHIVCRSCKPVERQDYGPMPPANKE